MFKSDKPNPFQVLRLPTSATTKAITERGDEQYIIAEPDDQLLYRWAVEELITHPLTRLLHELYEAPDTDYEDQDWENFLRKYKRNPIKRAGISKQVKDTEASQGTESEPHPGSAQGTIPTMENISPSGPGRFQFQCSDGTATRWSTDSARGRDHTRHA